MSIPESREVKFHRQTVEVRKVIKQERAISDIEKAARRVFGQNDNDLIEKAARGAWGLAKKALRSKTGNLPR